MNVVVTVTRKPDPARRRLLNALITQAAERAKQAA